MAERRWLLVLVAVLLLAVATAVAVPMLRKDSAPSATCRAATARSDELGNDYEAAAGNDAKQFRHVEELAVLMEQNPKCFTPSERATVEASYRRWKAAGFG